MQEAKKRRKMKSWFKIFVAISLFSFSNLNAQIGLHFNDLTILPLSSTTFNDSFFNNYPTVYKIETKPNNHLSSFDFQKDISKPFPKIYAFKNLAFFCKVEVKLEKAARFPVKFRLGDVNYVDQLEGKSNGR
jgi:hypothetical protein